MFALIHHERFFSLSLSHGDRACQSPRLDLHIDAIPDKAVSEWRQALQDNVCLTSLKMRVNSGDNLESVRRALRLSPAIIDLDLRMGDIQLTVMDLIPRGDRRHLRSLLQLPISVRTALPLLPSKYYDSVKAFRARLVGLAASWGAFSHAPLSTTGSDAIAQRKRSFGLRLVQEINHWQLQCFSDECKLYVPIKTISPRNGDAFTQPWVRLGGGAFANVYVAVHRNEPICLKEFIVEDNEDYNDDPLEISSGQLPPPSAQADSTIGASLSSVDDHKHHDDDDDHEKSIDELESAVSNAEQNMERDCLPLDLIQALYSLAVEYEHRKDHARAQPLYVRVLKYEEQFLGPDHVNVSTLLSLGRCLKRQGQLEQAKQRFDRARAIYEHESVEVQMNELALLLERGPDQIEKLSTTCVFATGFTVNHVDPNAPSSTRMLLMLPKMEGSLLGVLRKAPMPDLISWLVDVALSLKSLHEVGLLHRDVAARNILLARIDSALRKLTAKLSDFGLSCTVASPWDQQQTPCLWPPEWSIGQTFGMGGDVWAFGLLLAQVLRRSHGEKVVWPDPRWLLAHKSDLQPHALDFSDFAKTLQVHCV
jgi:serine/threonine protein kinase